MISLFFKKSKIITAEQKSAFTFEDAMAFVEGEFVVA